MLLDFGGSQETEPLSFAAYIVIGNDVVWSPDGASATNLPSYPGGDIWGIEVVFSSPSALDFAFMFIDTTGLLLNDDSFFVDDSLAPWDFAYFNLGQFGQPYNVIAQGSTVVPIPSSILANPTDANRSY